jgi:hypothetical protein
MSEHRTTHYAAESEDNARMVVAPINARLREAGWGVVSSVWSDRVPGYLEEEFKGHFWAHASAGGALTVVYEHDPNLPVLPSLRAAIEAAATSCPGVDEAVRKFARVALRTHLPIGQEATFMDALTARQTFMGEYLARRLERSPELAEAYRAIPARLRLEMERADADAFLGTYAV